MGLAMDEAVAQSFNAVSEVTNLAQSLQDGAGPQIDTALNEAQMLLEDIKKSLPDMTNKSNESETLLIKSIDIREKMALFASPLETPSQSLKILKIKKTKFYDDIIDIKNYTGIAKDKAMQTGSINDANRLVKNELFNETIKSVNYSVLIYINLISENR